MVLTAYINDRKAIQSRIEEEVKKKVKEEDKLEGETEEEYWVRKEIEKSYGVDPDDDEERRAMPMLFALDSDEIEDETAVAIPIHIALSSVYSCYVDKINLIQGKPVMVVHGLGLSYDCLYEESKYELIQEYINLNDKITLSNMSLQAQQLEGMMQQQFGSKMGLQNQGDTQHKIIPMSNADNNNN